jgi:hypothetical protein
MYSAAMLISHNLYQLGRFLFGEVSLTTVRAFSSKAKSSLTLGKYASFVSQGQVYHYLALLG